MGFTIRRAAVVGAGTMGASIAAHLANAGIDVRLLDLVPADAAGDPHGRNRLARAALERIGRATPPALFTPDGAARIRIGNLDDDLPALGDCDWIVEAIAEDLGAKQAICARLDQVRRADAIVSTNTSGLSVAAIAAHTSTAFREHFVGTHFFNPPRYLKLLEIIPTSSTRPEIVRFITEVGERALGKSIALCKDTPNFIANRYGSVTGAMVLGYVLDHGYTIEEVDAIMGPLVGRPRTGVFRLYDLVGLDVAASVGRNLYAAIPGDESREVLAHQRLRALFDALIARGWIGDKTGQGFYRKNKDRSIDTLDLDALDYRPRREPALASLPQAARIRTLPERLQFLLAQDDKAGALVRHAIYRSLAYAARRIPEISDDFLTVDDAVKWGFAHELGPFETWDALGLGETARAMEGAGIDVAEWVREFIATGGTSFYRRSGGALFYYGLSARLHVPAPVDPRRLSACGRAAAGGVIRENPSARLVDLGDGVACVEFRSKLNTLDDEMEEMLRRAVQDLKGEWTALVIGNEGADFCVGANLARLREAIAARAWDAIGRTVASVQATLQSLRYAPRPVVAAPFQRVLGGGVEICLAPMRIVAAAETYMGLVEVGVGLVPAAGGCKEMIRRVVSPAMRTAGADPLPWLRRVMQTLGTAQVSTSAEHARELGFLAPTDRIVMNRDFLLHEAKRTALAMIADGYQPPARGGTTCYAAGRDGLAALKAELHVLHRAGYASEYDRHVAGLLAHVLCGGDLSAPQWVTEEYFLDREREAFVSLCGEPKTLERIDHVLKTGKPLRN